MARFLTTVPVNHGYVNLGLVQAYPTGGTGPVAYGPTSYFGSDPRPASDGDSINNPINLGSFSAIFSEIPLTAKHGGLSRKQSTFYKINLTAKRGVQVTQDYSRFSYSNQTNRNTLISFYKLEDGNFRKELAINNDGYVVNNASINTSEEDNGERLYDYINASLDPGTYLFCITNDIRYQETEYSLIINIFSIEWEKVNQVVQERIDFQRILESAESKVDLGSIALV